MEFSKTHAPQITNTSNLITDFSGNCLTTPVASKNHNQFICLRTNGGKKDFRNEKIFTVMTWSKWENKTRALEVMRGMITTIKGKKEKWRGGSWESRVPKFQQLCRPWFECNMPAKERQSILDDTFSDLFWHETQKNLIVF